MKRRLSVAVVLILAVVLLCGCSNTGWRAVGDSVTNNKKTIELVASGGFKGEYTVINHVFTLTLIWPADIEELPVSRKSEVFCDGNLVKSVNQEMATLFSYTYISTENTGEYSYSFTIKALALQYETIRIVVYGDDGAKSTDQTFPVARIISAANKYAQRNGISLP